MTNWEVIVGNIGTVYSGTNGFEANTRFQTYVGQSNSEYGRAAGEDVTLMKDGEIHREFEGSNGRLPICDECGGEGIDGCICDPMNESCIPACEACGCTDGTCQHSA